MCTVEQTVPARHIHKNFELRIKIQKRTGKNDKSWNRLHLHFFGFQRLSAEFGSRRMTAERAGGGSQSMCGCGSSFAWMKLQMGGTGCSSNFGYCTFSLSTPALPLRQSPWISLSLGQKTVFTKHTSSVHCAADFFKSSEDSELSAENIAQLNRKFARNLRQTRHSRISVSTKTSRSTRTECKWLMKTGDKMCFFYFEPSRSNAVALPGDFVHKKFEVYARRACALDASL